MSILGWLRPAAPMGVAVVVLAGVLGAGGLLLPSRVTLVHTTDGAGAVFASRSDLLLVTTVLALVIVVAYLVSAAALAWTPVRHLWVPRPAYWKTPARRRELRRRLATYLARGTAAGLLLLAALVVVALIAQDGGPGALWWIPLAVSLGYVVAMIVWLVWVVTAGFAPDRAVEAASPISAARDGARTGAMPGRPAPDRSSPRGGDTWTAGDDAGRAAATPRTGAATAPAPPSARPTAAKPGGSGDRASTSPPRPYQPRPPHRGGPPRG